MVELESLLWKGEVINRHITVGNYRIRCITIHYGDSSGATSRPAPKWEIRQETTDYKVEIEHGKFDSETRKVYSDAVVQALKSLESDGSAKYKMFSHGSQQPCLELEVSHPLNTTKITCAAEAEPDTYSSAAVAVNIPSSEVGKYLLSDIAVRLGCALA